MLLNLLQHTGQPSTTKSFPAQMSMALWLGDTDLESSGERLYLLSYCRTERKSDWFSSKHDQEERFQQSGLCNIGRSSALKSQTGRDKCERDSLKLRLLGNIK